MNHLLVVPVAARFDEFDTCLESLVNSDYSGKLLVLEDGVSLDNVVGETCSRLGVQRYKFTHPSFYADMAKYVACISGDYDTVTFAHSDIIYPKEWFKPLDMAWNDLIVYDKIGCLNMNVIHRASNITWMTGKRRFELGWDIFNNGKYGIPQTGRLSPIFSMPSKHFRKMDHAEMGYTYIAELNYMIYRIQHKLWMIYLNTDPIIIHIGGADTARKTVGDVMMENLKGSYKKWMEISGIHIECSLYGWYSVIQMNHLEEIEMAANNCDFDSIDYIFDEFDKYHGNCSICPLSSRCPYNGTNKDPSKSWKEE